jgi:hypothetical protein
LFEAAFAVDRRQIAEPNLPDSRVGAGIHNDCGAFPDGEAPGTDWPREKATIFVPTRREAASMSKHQQVQAVRVASIINPAIK